MSLPQEWDFIRGLIRLQRPKTVVEIGVAGGHMAHSIYTAMNDNYNDTGIESWYTGFDLWDTHGIHGQFAQSGSLEIVEDRLKRIGHRYRLVKIDTQKDQKLFQEELASRFTDGIDFAFIDGCHSYQGIKNDFDKKKVTYFNNIKDACKNSDLLIIHTEWNEFKQLNFKKLNNKKKFKIYDLRNLYSPSKMKSKNIEYYSIGR